MVDHAKRQRGHVISEQEFSQSTSFSKRRNYYQVMTRQFPPKTTKQPFIVFRSVEVSSNGTGQKFTRGHEKIAFWFRTHLQKDTQLLHGCSGKDLQN